MKRKKTLQGRIDAMTKEIEQRGGIVGFAEDLPLELREEFLRKIVDCPDCAREAGRQRDH